MPIEPATNFSQLIPEYPNDIDPVFQGAGHMRLVKSLIKTTFPSITGPVTLTHTEINGLPASVTALGNSTVKLTAPDQTITGNLRVDGQLRGTTVLEGPNRLLPPGVIVLWSGAVNAIPAGWALCDGTNGTPNLRDRFVVGAGGANAVGATGGSLTSSGSTSTAGSHSHGGATTTAGGHSHGGVVGSTALSEAQIPAHSHGASASSVGDHTHGTAGNGGSAGILNDWRPGNTNNYILQDGGTNVFNSSPAGGHSHSITVGSTGGGQAHNHSIPFEGDHQHLIPGDGAHSHSVSVTTVPPFYALAYIMKL